MAPVIACAVGDGRADARRHPGARRRSSSRPGCTSAAESSEKGRLDPGEPAAGPGTVQRDGVPSPAGRSPFDCRRRPVTIADGRARRSCSRSRAPSRTTSSEQVARGRASAGRLRLLAAAFDADLLDYGEARARRGPARSGPRAGRRAGRPARVGVLPAAAALRGRSSPTASRSGCLSPPSAGCSGAAAVVTRWSCTSCRCEEGRPVPRLAARAAIDRFFVYATAQQRSPVDRLGVPADRVSLTPFMVDTDFFAPDRGRRPPLAPMICSAGLERRDYPTLVDAVERPRHRGRHRRRQPVVEAAGLVGRRAPCPPT